MYIATISNRDMPLLTTLQSHLQTRYGVSNTLHPFERTASAEVIIEALTCSLPALTVLKLTSDPCRNAPLLGAIEAVGMPVLNSVAAVRCCESRKATFRFLAAALPALYIPTMHSTLEAAATAIAAGERVLVRRDRHNIPKAERFLGIADSLVELARLTSGHDVNELILQDLLVAPGVHTEPRRADAAGSVGHTVYKVYVIGPKMFGLRCKQAEVFGLRSRADSEERCEVPPVVAGWMRDIRQVMKMEVFGVDCVKDDTGQYCIVDVNDFPNFGGIDDAVDLLGSHLVEMLGRSSGCGDVTRQEVDDN